MNGWLIRAQQPRSKAISCIGQSPGAARWPLQDIRFRSLQRFCERANHHFIAPPTCNAHTIPLQYSIARLPRKVRPSPDPPFVCYTPYNIGNGNIL